MGEESVEAVVIGGGANGSGLARDLALRGISVALVEKGDFARGATGASSGMIHGGPRYLLDDTDTTRHACRDSGYIQAIAPHLCFRIPFLLPVPKQNPFGPFGLLLHDVFFDVYDRYTPLKNGIRHARLSPAELAHIEPGLKGEVLGGIALDEWGIDVGRLCLGNALDAKAHGAKLHTYQSVVDVLQAPDHSVAGVLVEDETGKQSKIRAKAVINCAGPWADSLVTGHRGQAVGQGALVKGDKAARLRPGKGVHLVYDKRLSNFAIITDAKDGRQIFVMPYMNETWIGTTDDDYYGNLDDLWATADEVAYLREAGERVLPALRHQRLIGTRVGVRNTIHGWGVAEDALSRRHEVVDHKQEGAAGFFTLLGGKLASFRGQAEEAANAVCAFLGHGGPCTTATRALPGGASAEPVEQLASRFHVAPMVARRLLARHGSEAGAVLEHASGVPLGLTVLDPSEPTLRGEVSYCLANEHVTHLGDLMMRCRLAMGADMGLHSAAIAAQMMAEQRGLSVVQERRELMDLLVRRWRSARPVLEGPQLAATELWLNKFVGLWQAELPPDLWAVPAKRTAEHAAAEPVAVTHG